MVTISLFFVIVYDFERSFKLPCITILDISENGEVADLGGEKDEYSSLVQIDVWSKTSPLSRDELAKAVKVALGKNRIFKPCRQLDSF